MPIDRFLCYFYIVNMKVKETQRQRTERIKNSNNGATLRTRVVEKKRKRNKKVDIDKEMDE